MVYKLEFDKRAVSELTDIVSWYATKSPSAAEKFETAFKWVLETLAGVLLIIYLSPKRSKELLFRIFLTPFTIAGKKKQRLFSFMQFFIRNESLILFLKD